MIRECMAYAASKGGVIAATRFLAVYWAKHNINVNCISPGGFYRNQEEHFVKNYCYRTPLGRMGGNDESEGRRGLPQFSRLRLRRYQPQSCGGRGIYNYVRVGS